MKVLILSYHFPPSPAVGGLRVASLAEHLMSNGHTIRVLTSEESRARRGSTSSVPDEVVLSARGDTRQLFAGRMPLDDTSSAAPPPAQGGNHPARPLRNKLRDLAARSYRAVAYLPDQNAGWVASAGRVASRLISDWRPDVILASGPPFSCFVVAARLSARFGIPWVADYRDPWSSNADYNYGALRRKIDRTLERRAVRTAGDVLTTSAVFADDLSSILGRQVRVVLNGYVPSASDHAGPAVERLDGKLTIVHTGQLYQGRRDPTAVFKALRLMGSDAAAVKVHFFGPNLTAARDAAAGVGCLESVEFHPQVSHAESLAVQRSADVLLLLLWNDPRGRGMIPAKLFEYVAARRPVLMVGEEDAEAAGILRDRNLGLVTSDPEVIAKQLAQWLREKETHGSVAGPSVEATRGLTREEQNVQAAEVLEQVATGSGSQRSAR